MSSLHRGHGVRLKVEGTGALGFGVDYGSVKGGGRGLGEINTEGMGRGGGLPVSLRGPCCSKMEPKAHSCMSLSERHCHLS